ncbi:hypothetical protein EG240_14960 [Paenimyroides tangerinum]|uniref:PAS domain-containing protein n=1 Tax=Paenimyroides tangerinum TaxID=2488728 RepID=A0A3P3VXW7_9FLAO|nr:LuxR C-terminal-related transcriptional regulator [Paenimyroides tangerinum]RRJ87652.1 hypothetical protein EG240_14960 [Paenimyroides tangerinum]
MGSKIKQKLGLGSEWDFWFDHPHTNEIINEKRKIQSYYFIFDCEVNDIEYVSKSISAVLGYSSSEFNMAKFFESIHPEDLQYCNECEHNSFQISNHIFYKEIFKYIISYSFRLKTKEGNYLTIKQEYQTIETDEYGRMLRNFVHHEVIDSYEKRSEFDFQIIDKIKNRPVNFEKKFKLTKREVEILDLINQGFQTKEISEQLNLSDHTVKTHRKNILQKTQSSSLIQVLNKVRI